MHKAWATALVPVPVLATVPAPAQVPAAATEAVPEVSVREPVGISGPETVL